MDKPRRQPAAAVANMYYVGAINRVGIEPLGDNDFYGQSYFVDPEGKFVGDVGDAHKPELIVRDLDLAKINADMPPEEDRQLRKRLWLKVAKYVVQEKGDIKACVLFYFNLSVLTQRFFIVRCNSWRTLTY